MAREMLRKLKPGSLAKKPPVPSIEITLTSFHDDEYGRISEAVTVPVKIDGEAVAVHDPGPAVLPACSVLLRSPAVRNLLVLSLGQFLLFMAFDSLSNLQSTINGADGIGTTSLAVVYGVITASSFFLPTLVIRTLGCKRTLVLCTAGFCPYVLGNLYPSYAVLVPTAVLCGVVSGPLCSARSTYLNQISHQYAKARRASAEVTNAWFFSVCTTFQQNTEIWGNLLAYFVLRAEGPDRETLVTRSVLEACGPDFCDEEGFGRNPNLILPAVERRYVLVTIFAALVLTAAFFTAFFLEPLESEGNENENREASSSSSAPQDVLAAFYQFTNIDQMLLVPLSLYTGLVDGFYNGDYTKAYVACAWGVPHVGAVSVCYGVVSALVDSAGAPCVLVLGRAGLFFLACAAHLGMFAALTLWRPDPDHTAGFFLVAAAHGIGNGVWMSQLVALYGVLFRDNEEAAFSCFYFLNSLGFLIAYAYSSHLCTNVKLYIPLTILVIGLLCYLAVEVRQVRKSVSQSDLKRDQ